MFFLQEEEEEEEEEQMVVVETRAGRAKASTPAMMGGAKLPSSAKRLGHTHFLGQSLCVSGPQKTKSEASCFSSHFGKCYLRSDVLFDLLGGNVKVRSSQLLLLRVSWPFLLFFFWRYQKQPANNAGLGPLHQQ